MHTIIKKVKGKHVIVQIQPRPMTEKQLFSKKGKVEMKDVCALTVIVAGSVHVTLLVIRVFYWQVVTFINDGMSHS